MVSGMAVWDLTNFFLFWLTLGGWHLSSLRLPLAPCSSIPMPMTVVDMIFMYFHTSGLFF